MSAQHRPVVFACAGCSLVGRLAYDLALELDRRGLAEMSCLAGLACEKKPFLKKVEGREVWIIDGCPIECALGVLDRLRRRADVHVRLDDFGVRKHHPPPEGVDVDGLIEKTLEQAAAARGTKGTSFPDPPPAAVAG
jgi:uncharacterized metal-binding protein